ncbi:dirigent protein 19-like [Panicum miliaceum]|uniref:Dirigent protein 19-like n=1 Tax=Panicum miliaceum TaxID=4540 RepID=A0A3L6TML7_PANMI|nr:dirigent protein 19-like [Panicum miliaceum]
MTRELDSGVFVKNPLALAHPHNGPQLFAKQLVAVAIVAFLLAAASGRRQPVHLRLYMHDVMRGLRTTAIHLIHGVGHPPLRGAAAPPAASRCRGRRAERNDPDAGGDGRGASSSS